MIVVSDGDGFYTIADPRAVHERGVARARRRALSVEAIDQALVDWGWPVGPITLLDEVGIDVAAHVGRIMHEAFGARVDPPSVVAKAIGDDAQGSQERKGVLSVRRSTRHKKGKGKHVDPTIYAALGLPKPVDRAPRARRRHPDALLAAVRQRGPALPGRGHSEERARR